MNIFALDHDPTIAAKYMCDKHVVKMLTEYAQILWTALRRHGYDREEGYKSAYSGHPSTRWAGDTRANWLWLHSHASALAREYARRYPRERKFHGAVRATAKARKYSHYIPEGSLSTFSIAIAPTTRAYRYIDPLRPVHTYRIYYVLDKTWAKWTNREEPDWLEYYRRTYVRK